MIRIRISNTQKIGRNEVAFAVLFRGTVPVPVPLLWIKVIVWLPLKDCLVSSLFCVQVLPVHHCLFQQIVQDTGTWTQNQRFCFFLSFRIRTFFSFWGPGTEVSSGQTRVVKLRLFSTRIKKKSLTTLKWNTTENIIRQPFLRKPVRYRIWP